MRQREIILAALSDSPRAEPATAGELLGFINREVLYARGVGYVDAHFLASVRFMRRGEALDQGPKASPCR
jgi:hypothetical protein